MSDKKFKFQGELKKLIEPIGSALASDKITVDGLLVGFMYREEPSFETDSGWRFFSGTESQEYVDNPDNLLIFDLNTIANFDEAIIPYLYMEIGVELERKIDNTFCLVE